MEKQQNQQNLDSFTIGTAATGGAIKVYFNGDDDESKILRAKQLYYTHVEIDRMKKAGGKTR